MVDPKLRKAIDACRPGSDDLSQLHDSATCDRILHDAAAAELYDAIQQSDRLVQRALHEVDVPEGLRDRLLNSISDADRHSESVVVAAASSRRRFVLTAVGLCGVAASLVATFAVVWRGANDGQFYQTVRGWIEELDGDQWLKLPRAGFVRSYRPDNRLRIWPTGYQRINTRLDKQTVAYQLQTPGETQAYLFVAANQQYSDLPAGPSVEPPLNTGGWIVDVWQSDGLTYALAVRGSSRVYHSLVQQRRSLAMTGRGSSRRGWTCNRTRNVSPRT